ncbi:MAG: hypothetical protein JKY54_12915 [Flavobacteriales bacterium]|nr:hypothetical protein [Flavobacteriales bacterium]
MSRYEALKETSERLAIEINKLTVWLVNTKERRTELILQNSKIEENPPELKSHSFLPYINLGNRQNTSFGFLTFESGSDELEELMEVISPYLEKRRDKLIAVKLRIDTRLQAIEELLAEDSDEG